MNAAKLRNEVLTMTKEQFIILRDELENNWSDELRPLMIILSKACINRFKTTLINLEA